MAQFVDLPLDLLPGILQFVVRPNHLAAARLVNRRFDVFAGPLLFENVSIYAWNKDAKNRVKQLFRVLANYPHVAKWVRTLEMRDFPKSMDWEAFQAIIRDCCRGIDNCINLQNCAWTRDGSVNKMILDSLLHCHNLRELEINAGVAYYDAECLPQFRELRKIALIMPSASVMKIFPSWMSSTGSSLLDLNLVCKTSGLITDDILESIAPSLNALHHLNLLGCSRVTFRGVWSIISQNTNGLRSLGLQNLSTGFDMEKFSRLCTRATALQRLKKITLSIDAVHNVNIPEWFHQVKDLLLLAPLEVFQVYSTFAHFEAASLAAMTEFCTGLVATHGQRLTRFSVHRMTISPESIIEMCDGCPLLEELFIVAHPKELDVLTTGFGRARKLRRLHINYPLEDDPEDTESDEEYPSPVMSLDEAQKIVRRCGPALVEFGCNTRVWMINRVVSKSATGELAVIAELSKYESPSVPEQFLVVQT